VALAASVGLVTSPRSGETYLGGLVYCGTLVALFGMSGSYHWVNWSFRTRRILRQLDHSGIFLLIAGSYSAFWSLTPVELRSSAQLWAMWASAVFGIVAFVKWTDMHRALRAATYVVLGLSTLPLAVQMPTVLGGWRTALAMSGGLVYVLGAGVYAQRWPNPSPRVFGYHEVFHVMVILAAALQFWVIVDMHWAR
jgi:hemolysin III